MTARWRWLGVPPLLAGLTLAIVGSGYEYTPAWTPRDTASSVARAPRTPTDRWVAAALRRLQPRGSYIIIDQTHNRLKLIRGGKVLVEAPCSSGSGMVLREGPTGRRWVFDTPRGRFRVMSRLEDPVWRKPDWAFIEEGRPIPEDPSERFEYGMLGEYALSFGDGYMIHGTLYERLLGRSVTHGCIRLGREPLRRVYEATSIGTPIFIF